MTDYTDLVERLRNNKDGQNPYKKNMEAADTIETQAAEIDFWKGRMREALKTIKENVARIAELEKELDKHRQALAFIQSKAQDTLRPIPFQDEDE